MYPRKWGIRKMVSTGLGIDNVATVLAVDVPEEGTFDSEDEAGERAHFTGRGVFSPAT